MSTFPADTPETLYRFRAGPFNRVAGTRVVLIAFTLVGVGIGAGYADDDQTTLRIVSTGAAASLRGIAVAANGTVIVGGSDATLVKTTDDGATWSRLDVDVPPASDFRDVEFMSNDHVVAMSAGPGELSRVLVSHDAARTWSTVLVNDQPTGFFNGMDFNNRLQGVLVGDPVGGRLTVYRTADGGITWQPKTGPQLEEGEYGFAASGTGVSLAKNGRIVVVTGGARCRCHVYDPGADLWTAVDIGIRSGNASSGAFSVAMQPDGRGIAIGGDYQAPDVADDNMAFTDDGGVTWKVSETVMPHKACVRFVGRSTAVTCGRTGVAISHDAGRNWKAVSRESFYALSLVPVPVENSSAASTRTVWLAGANGRAASLTLRVAEASP